MSDKIASIVDMERELDAAIDQLVDLKREIIRKLDQMDTTEAMYLTERYLNLHTPAHIAEEHGVTTRWVRDIISRGVAHLQVVLSSDS